MKKEEREKLKETLKKRSVSQLKKKLDNPDLPESEKDIIIEILDERGYAYEKESGTRVKDSEALAVSLPTKKRNWMFNYNFTEEELKEKSLQLAQICNEKNRIDDDKKSAASSFKSKLDAKQSEINLLSNQIATGSEMVTKTCDCIYDHDRGIKTYIYDGKEVGQEKMTSADYQGELELE